MDKIIIFSLIILFFLLKFYFSFRVNEKFNDQISDLTPVESNLFAKELIKKNKNKYQKYQKYMETHFKENKEQYGYTILPNTNPDTLGFCPLGKYFDGEFNNKPEDVFTKCKDCKNCLRNPGYYNKGGCLGDKDAKCHFGKLPFKYFKKAHTYPHMLHSQIHRHKHKYGENNYSNEIHSHE